MARGSRKTKAEESPPQGGAPRVFISSTAEDLQEHRQQAKEAAIHADLMPVLHEYWAARDNDPCSECMARVAQCDVLVVLVAHRYGWEPPDQPVAEGAERKSITWLECEWAVAKGKQVLAFLVDERAAWPAELREEHAVTVALAEHEADSPEFRQVSRTAQRGRRRLLAFKDWLRSRGIRAEFTDPGSVGQRVERALREWREEHRPRTTSTAAPGAGGPLTLPEEYLAWVKKDCGAVELLGLDVKDGHTPKLRDVYVPAVTLPAAAHPMGSKPKKGKVDAREAEPRRDALMLDRLATESLYVPGAPGSGKTTFSKWAAWLCAHGGFAEHPIAPPDDYRESFPASFGGRLPVRLVLRECWQTLAAGEPADKRWTRAQMEDALAAWADRVRPDGLDGEVLRAFLERGKVLLILDGIDEVPVSDGMDAQSGLPRARLISGLTDALPHWHKQDHRVLLTGRPYGLTAVELATLGLLTAPLQPLPDGLQALFVVRWFRSADPEHAATKAQGLVHDLQQRRELRELTANPMLLTALCVLYNHGQRLPDDQFHLYDSVIDWVLHHRYPDSRQRGPARRRLAAIAHGMHTGCTASKPRTAPEPRVTEAELDQILADYAGQNRATEGERDAAAGKRADLLDNSGLLLPVADQRAEFYHLSFQEYLAAEHLAQIRDDGKLLDVLRVRGAEPRWRATLVHLFGALAFRHRSAQEAVDLIGVLVREATRERVQTNPAIAVWLADCLDLAVRKEWNLGPLRDAFVAVCLHAIEDEVEVKDRARLGLALGWLGDPRPGVGVRDGVPDIQWVPIPGGSVQLEETVFLSGGGIRRDVAPFAMARYPVTNAQWQAFLDAEDGYHDDAWWTGVERSEPEAPAWSDANAPRENVSWFDAVAFCRWLSRRVGHEVRLPTEHEWQQAATQGDVEREYPWGTWNKSRCNYDESGIGRTSTVGIFPNGASEDGPMDLAGNVWEWCADEAEAYGSAVRVMRGGSWLISARRCRAASRRWGHQSIRNDFLGFRPASSSPAPFTTSPPPAAPDRPRPRMKPDG